MRSNVNYAAAAVVSVACLTASATAFATSPSVFPSIYSDPFLWDDLVVRGTVTTVAPVTFAPKDWYSPALLKEGISAVELVRIVVHAPEVLRGRIDSPSLALLSSTFADELRTIQVDRSVRPGSDIVATARYRSDRDCWIVTALFIESRSAPSPTVGRCWRRLAGTVPWDSLYDYDVDQLVGRVSVPTMTLESDVILKGRVTLGRDVGEPGNQHQEYVVEPQLVLRGGSTDRVVFEAGGAASFDESQWRMRLPFQPEVGTLWYFFLRERDGALIPTAGSRSAFRIVEDELFEDYDVPSAYSPRTLERAVFEASAPIDSLTSLLEQSHAGDESHPQGARVAAVREFARLLRASGPPCQGLPPRSSVIDMMLDTPFLNYGNVDTTFFAYERADPRDILQFAPRVVVCFPVRYRNRVICTINVREEHGRYEASGGFGPGVDVMVDRLDGLRRALDVPATQRVSLLNTGIVGNYYIVEDGQSVYLMAPADIQTMNLLGLAGSIGEAKAFAPPESFGGEIRERIVTARRVMREEAVAGKHYDSSKLERDVLHCELIVRGVVASVTAEMAPYDSLFQDKRPGESFPVTVIEVAVQGVLKGSWADSTIRAVLPGNPKTGGYFPDASYNYEVDEEVVLCLHYDSRVMGGAYRLWGDAGSFVKRGKEWETRDGEMVTLAAIVANSRSTEPGWMARCADAIALGTIESVERKEFDCGFPTPCVADYATVRIMESWRGVAAGESIMIRALRRGTNLPWYAPMPRLAVGEVYIMFLRRDDIGFYPFAGFNGFLEVDGQRLVMNRFVDYPASFAEMIEKIQTGN